MRARPKIVSQYGMKTSLSMLLPLQVAQMHVTSGIYQSQLMLVMVRSPLRLPTMFQPNVCVSVLVLLTNLRLVPSVSGLVLQCLLPDSQILVLSQE